MKKWKYQEKNWKKKQSTGNNRLSVNLKSKERTSDDGKKFNHKRKEGSNYYKEKLEHELQRRTDSNDFFTGIVW